MGSSSNLFVFLSPGCLQTFRLRLCCQAVVLDLEPLPQKASLRNIWQRSSPWASVEIRQPKRSEQRLVSQRPFRRGNWQLVYIWKICLIMLACFPSFITENLIKQLSISLSWDDDVLLRNSSRLSGCILFLF